MGDAAAQYALGVCHFNGEKGLAKSPQLVAKWWAKSATGGNADAQLDLGFLYERGKGVLQDKAESTRLYRRAACQGLPLAMAYLGLALSEGRGCDEDPVLAVQWMLRALG